ncbi:TIGR04282 family arsenosugar biosynthesis glycosyltransferase [Zobellella maritima]|uniref:TIGR04282 family arsenosugar biosynthesis glycosyltransferase n=1 Tax=Zobellella maritima TaxID=2059725 RepID=UPI000E3039CA|nr:TIGR04282 family arsenosugar biosynthesis glycosyltransferase [Zobellella maritima]
MNRARIIIFAKAPRPGLAKTRLIPALGAEGAARLARHMLLSTIERSLAASLGPVELCMTPTPDDPAWADIPLPTKLICSDQGAGNLGERMARAAARGLTQAPRVLLIGTDCPALTPLRLQAAAERLNRHDAVIHPALDGGYVLLGLTRFSPRLFADIPWSTAQVGPITLARLDALGWSYHKAEPLSDIDVPGDLHLLPDHWINS